MLIIDDLLIKLPIRGFVGIFKRIAEMADEELNDKAKLKENLMQLEFLYETDQISEEEYEKKQAEILERLSQLEDQEEPIRLGG
jgi:hypothetical protein